MTQVAMLGMGITINEEDESIEVIVTMADPDEEEPFGVSVLSPSSARSVAMGLLHMAIEATEMQGQLEEMTAAERTQRIRALIEQTRSSSN